MPQPPNLTIALDLAAVGLPVLPLRAKKLPVGNCDPCRGNACGGRPNMKHAGPCHCPAPCHAWAAATTNHHTLNSPAWTRAWREARAVAYHPAGANLTVVDLDTPQAVDWARATLPTTRTVGTSRGWHWIYRGTCPSATNAMRHEGIPGVDIKSHGAYAVWRGAGAGDLALLPTSIHLLTTREEEATPARKTGAGVASSPATQTNGWWDYNPGAGCRHTPTYLQQGLDRGLAKIQACAETGASSQAFGVAKFLATRHQHCPGPCSLGRLSERLIAATVEVGVPETYARRAVTNGLNAGAAR